MCCSMHHNVLNPLKFTLFVHIHILAYNKEKGVESLVYIHGQNVLGIQVDSETRCAHYHKEIDRIAIKFYCCNQYFPCYECHAQCGCGQPKPWPKNTFDQKAVLCGDCGYELTVAQYLNCQSNCPNCHSTFNPSCSLHAHLYFETEKGS